MRSRQGLALLLVALLVVVTWAEESSDRGVEWSQLERIFSTTPPPGMSCAPTAEIPVAGLNLTQEEQGLLQYICWQPELAAAAAAQEQKPAQPRLGAARGIPPGVTCDPVTWCDGDVCTEVCGAGTVAVEPWLGAAVRLQAGLSRSLPFCFATLLGTHNSGISLADGYGNLDPYFQQYFKYIKWALSDFSDAPLRTNDQWLSLTDQLRLGVRALELDTHWVGGALRIAHCGGFHIEPLNQLIRAINLVAKLLHKNIRWDTETLGCVPSLSSIPAMEQRTLVEALAEVNAWMGAPGNEEEFVLLFLDDQPDLMSWGVVEHLLGDIQSVFAAEEIFTVDDLAAYQAAQGPGAWPPAAEMVAAGKRVLFVSRADYGTAMRPLVFSRSDTVCGWTEPDLARVEGVPQCVVHMAGGQDAAAAKKSEQALFSGTLFRVETCELEYGPLNCNMVYRGSNQPYLDEATLPAVLSCGLNQPAPDLLTPSKAAAAIWTWAPGHPFEPIPAGGGLGSAGLGAGSGDSSSSSSRAAAAAARQRQGAGGKGGEQAPLRAQLVGEQEEANCAVISAEDGRWRAVPCGQVLPSACREAAGEPAAAGSGSGNGGLPSAQWVLSAAGAPRGACPEGSAFDIPRHPVDSFRLASLLRQQGAAAAWLPLAGPGWEPPPAPAAGEGKAAAAE